MGMRKRIVGRRGREGTRGEDQGLILLSRII